MARVGVNEMRKGIEERQEKKRTKGEREARDEQREKTHKRRAWKNARARKHDQSVDNTIREQ